MKLPGTSPWWCRQTHRQRRPLPRLSTSLSTPWPADAGRPAAAWLPAGPPAWRLADTSYHCINTSRTT